MIRIRTPAISAMIGSNNRVFIRLFLSWEWFLSYAGIFHQIRTLTSQLVLSVVREANNVRLFVFFRVFDHFIVGQAQRIRGVTWNNKGPTLEAFL